MTRSKYISDLAVCGCSALADTFTADQIPGNRLRLKKDVTVYLGHPGSSNTETWKAGFLSPPVYSWVTRDGDVYWMIGELQPVRYVKHESSTFELVPDHGGAPYLGNDKEPFFGSLFDFADGVGKNLNKILLVAAIGVGAYALTPLILVSRKK